MSVTLVDVLAAARARCAPLVGELAGYLVLGVADQVAAAPRRVAAADVTLGPDGAVALVGGRAASEQAAEASLRDLLKQLLVNARSASPALSRASRGSCGRGVAAMVRELEASLIPVNRAAGKRAATRLYRETKRAVDEGLLAGWRDGEGDQQRAEMASQALGELSDAPDVEVVVELSSPPPPEVASALEAAGQVPAVDAPSKRAPAVEAPAVVEEPALEAPAVQDDVTRPEPLARRAARSVELESSPSRDVRPGQWSSDAPAEPQAALTPRLGSIAAVQSSAARPDGRCGLPEPMATLLDTDRTDPMHQGEYLEISESLGNYALSLGVYEDDLEDECRTASSPPAPVVENTGGSAPASAPDASRQAFVMESPPWQPRATAGSDARAQPAAQWLRDPEWAWPDVSPVPPAPELVAPSVLASPGDLLPRGAHQVRVTDSVAVSCGLVVPEDSFPPEDGWDVPAVEEAAAALLRATRAPSTFPPRRSQVEDLVASFSVADQREDGDVCRDLKRMAGLDLTPLPGAGVADD